MKVRSWVRNRFLASCWVSVEPPCETPRCRTLATAARAMPIGIDAVMRIEPAVLDGDERLRQMRRQILQRNIGAGHFAAGRQHAAVEADNLDCRRPLRDFKRLDRRQMRADPDHDADRRDHAPEAEHRAPVNQAAEAAAGPGSGLALAARPASHAACARAAHRRRNRWPCAWRDGFFFGSSSPLATRSCGPRRSSLSDAASPNCGSLRPPLFFRPHAIRQRRPHRSCRTLAGGI